MTEKQKNAEQIAGEILRLSRNMLLVNLRFLDAALNQLEPRPVTVSSVLTDGKRLYYRPEWVLRAFQTAKEIPVRDHLHVVMHCIFRHMYMSPTIDREYWDLACDIAAEYVITGLGIKAAEAPRQEEQRQYFKAFQHDLNHVTAEKLYAYLRQTAPNPMRLAQLRDIFSADDHALWYLTPQGVQEQLGTGEQSEQAAEPPPGESRAEQAKRWQEISERIQLELETFEKQRGITPGGLVQTLAAVNREKYDYTAFLRKFAVLGEAMRINDEEFDYIFYTYGLRLYEKMPLIEPLEYKEIKAIREFVIAIDTSGSVSGELVQAFIRKTYNILNSTESFFTKINLHIIQCDAAIQEDRRITCREEFDEYLKTMRIHGLGGTDFRPVFEYVQTLRRQKALTNLKGLIYFTDGYGVFPKKKPDYHTVFVFLDEEYNNPNVPAWAIRLVLQKDEIYGMSESKGDSASG